MFLLHFVRLCPLCLVLCLVLCVCPPASSGRLHSCITFHLSSLLDRVSAASSFSRAGPGAMPRGQQLIGLRKALYRALRSAFRASRRATCHMLKAYPFVKEKNELHNWVFSFKHVFFFLSVLMFLTWRINEHLKVSASGLGQILNNLDQIMLYLSLTPFNVSSELWDW